MVKIKHKDNEIDVESFKDFYDNHFDKESLTPDYTMKLSRPFYKEDGTFDYYHNYFYVEKKLDTIIKDGDIINLFPIKIFSYSGGLMYSN